MSAWRPTSRVGLLVAFLLVPAVVGAIVQFSPGRAARRRTAAEHRADPHGRPARGHAPVHADRATDAGQARCDVHERLRLEPRLLSEPRHDHDGPVLALDGRVHERPGRRVRRVRRQLDDRHVAARCRVPHRPVRQVPERVRDRLHAAGMGPLVRHARERRLLRLLGDVGRQHRRLRGQPPRTTGLGGRRRGDLVHPRHPGRATALRVREPPGAARARDPRPRRRRRIRQARALATAQLQRDRM